MILYNNVCPEKKKKKCAIYSDQPLAMDPEAPSMGLRGAGKLLQ